MTNITDQEAAEAHRARLKKQASYSAKDRDKNKTRRRPERDDVASAALRFLLTSAVRQPERAPAWTATISRDLANLKRPFDPVETTAVFEAMVKRHREAMERAASERAAERDPEG